MNEWIKIYNDGDLPSEWQRNMSRLVLVFGTDESGDAFMCTDFTVNGEWSEFASPEYDITHWQSMPEPPKM